VTKPLDVSHGRGVSLNLNSLDEVRWGYEQAAVYTKYVLVEQFLAGKDYRVLVINNKVVAAAERVPAHVVGRWRAHDCRAGRDRERRSRGVASGTRRC
jgi:cyanophycin synthetase